MATLLDVYNQTPIQWDDFVVQYDNPGFWEESYYELSAKDYLAFSKYDFRQQTDHSYMNALANAKKAIDCKIDSVIRLFGYEPIELKKNKVVHEYIEKYKHNNEIIEDNPIKIKLLQSLELAPQYLLSKIRELRNRVEHEYIRIGKIEAKEAIEVADLFINSVNC